MAPLVRGDLHASQFKHNSWFHYSDWLVWVELAHIAATLRNFGLMLAGPSTDKLIKSQDHFVQNRFLNQK